MNKLSGIALFTLLVCSGFSQWVTQKDAAFGYSVSMPTPVTKQDQSETEANLVIKNRLLLHQGPALTLVFAACKPSRAMTAAEKNNFTTALKAAFLRSSGATKTGEAKGTMNKYKGEYMDFTRRDGRKGRIWLIISAANIYALTAVWQNDAMYKSGALKFFNSFKPSGR